MKLSSNVVGDSNDEKDFQHKLLSTNTQVTKLRKALGNTSSANMKLSKTQLHKIGQSGEFLGRLLGSLLKTGVPLMKNVLKPLVKCVLIPLGLTAAASTKDAAIQKKVLGSCVITLIILNKEMKDIMKIVKFLEEPDLLIKGVCETIQNESKEQKRRLLEMLLGILGAKKFIGNENVIINVYRIQAYDSIIYGNFCIRFIDFILEGTSLRNYKKIIFS